MDLEKSVRMNLGEFEWMNMCVSLSEFGGKMSGFEDEFYES